MKNIIAVLLTLLVLTAIGLTACTCQTEEIALEDTPWVLESYGEPGNLQAVLEDTEITALFDSAEDKVSGSAGCNNYFAGYEINNNEVSIIAPVGSTEMYCEGIMEQEDRYLELLESAETFQIQDKKLHIFSSGGQKLIFKVQ